MTGVRQLARRFYPFNDTVLCQDLITDRRGRLNYLYIILTFQTFLDYLYMQQAEKAASKTKAQRGRIMRAERETSIIKGKFIKSFS